MYLTFIQQQWEVIDHTTSQVNDRIRRINPGLGCILSGDESRRPLAESGKKIQHKHVGVEGGFSGSSDIRSNEEQHSHIAAAGQQNSNSLYQSEGGEHMQNPSRTQHAVCGTGASTGA